MTDIKKIVRAFELFNEKADKLVRLSFIRAMLEPNSGVTISWKATDDGGYQQTNERRGPGEEAIDAFVLTFRFFIQDNEQSSFRMMADHYADAPIDEELKQKFAQVRKQVNDILDGPSDMSFSHNDEPFSRRRIMDVFVYGGLAHANAAKKELYDVWMSIPPCRPFVENEFVYTLALILDAILYIKELNQKALAQLAVVNSHSVA